jgi:putative colanic acid biosynthesis acetyltransferase WcaF
MIQLPPVMLPELDISANRAARKYSAREMTLRTLWMCGQLVFRLTPRPCFACRNMLLRSFGARLAAHVNIYASTRVYFPWNLSLGKWSSLGEGVLIYNLGQVTLGKKVTVSHGAHLCAGTHDYTGVDLPLLKPSILVQDQAWICTEAFIGPGVVVGEGAVVGARAVVTKDVAPWSVVAGNPAQPIGTRHLRTEVARET